MSKLFLSEKLKQILEINNSDTYITKEQADKLYNNCIDKQTTLNLRIDCGFNNKIFRHPVIRLDTTIDLIIELFKSSKVFKRDDIVKIILGRRPRSIDIDVIYKALNILRIKKFIDDKKKTYWRNEYRHVFHSGKKKIISHKRFNKPTN